MADETQPAEGTAEKAPDLSEQFADLGAKFDQVLERLPAEESEPEPRIEDIGQPEPEPEPEVEPYQPPDPYAFDEEPEPEADPRIDELMDWAVGREQKEATERLIALGEKHPELRDPETVKKVQARVKEITDDPVAQANANLVEAVYLGLKAEADAEASSAEEADEPTGAAIETGATGGAPTSFDPDQAFVDAFGSSREKTIF